MVTAEFDSEKEETPRPRTKKKVTSRKLRKVGTQSRESLESVSLPSASQAHVFVRYHMREKPKAVLRRTVKYHF